MIAHDTTSAPGADPLAVVIGNGSLTGFGYLMLGRRRLAAGTGLVTLLLVITQAAVFRARWLELVIVLWWLALMAHGWLLASSARRATLLGQRLVAAGLAVPVLLGAGLLRHDAATVERTLDVARAEGSCALARDAVDRIWLGHRVIDAPMAERGDAAAEACRRLEFAEAALSNAVATTIDRPDSDLRLGFRGLGRVLAELPGHEPMVVAAVERFRDRLPADDPCVTAAVTDWLGQRPASGDALDRATEVVARLAPAALVECGNDLTTSQVFDQARGRYQQVLDDYPDHEAAGLAGVGMQDLELAVVRTSGGSYCREPKPYSRAAPYAPGINRVLFYNLTDEYTTRLPADWRAGDVADAVLIACADSVALGAAVETCFYERKPGDLPPLTVPGRQPLPGHEVTFHEITIPIQAYELRTGRRVVETTVAIRGASCPKVYEYETSLSLPNLGPPGSARVIPSDADLMAAFEPVVIGR